MPSADLYTVTPVYQPKLTDFKHDRRRNKIRKEGEFQFETMLDVKYEAGQDARMFCSFGDKCGVPEEHEGPEIHVEVGKCEYAERQGCPFNYTAKELAVIVFDDSVEEDVDDDADGDDDTQKIVYQLMHTIHGFPFFKAGTFNDVTFTEADLDLIVKNFFALKAQVKPVLKFGHGPQKFLKGEGMPALGWVEGIRRVGNMLLADIANIPERVYNLIQKKAFRRPSAEVYRDFVDESGQKHGAVLSGIALLGAEAPAIKTLPDIELLFNTEGFTDVMTAFNDNASRNDNPAAIDFDEGEEDDSKDDGDKKMPDELSAEEKAELEQLRASKADVEKREQGLKDREAEEAKLAESRRLQNHQEFLAERKKEGKILPVHEPKLLAVMTHLADDSTDEDNLITLQEDGKDPRSLTPLALFKEVMSDMPDIVKLSELSEKGDDDKVKPKDKDVEAKYREDLTSESDKTRKVTIEETELATLAEKIAAEKSIPYGEALIEASEHIRV